MLSNTVDYFIEGAKNTYNKTITFWSGDNKLDRTIEAVKFTASQPQLFVDQLSTNIDTSLNELDTAVTKDRNNAIFAVLAIVGVYIYFKKGGKK